VDHARARKATHLENVFAQFPFDYLVTRDTLRRRGMARVLPDPSSW
jgi:hypothetical protein